MPRTKPSRPTSLLKLDGSFRKDRHGNRMDADLATLPPDFSFPPAPDGLHPRVSEQWGPWIKALLLKRVLTPADFSTLEIGFRHLSEAMYYSDMIAAEGMPESLNAESLQRRGYINRLFQESTKSYLKVMYEYGSTPAARAALKVPAGNERDIDPLEVVLGN